MRHLLRTARPTLAVLIFLTLSAASCPPDRAALNTLQTLRATAEHAVAVVKAGRAQTPPLFTLEQENAARDYYAKYLAADKVTAEGIQAGLNPTTELVSKAVNDLIAFVNAIQKKGP